MSRVAAGILSLLSLLVPTAFIAQSAPSAPGATLPRDPNGVAVVQQVVTALGGSAAVGQIQGCVATGNLQALPGSGLTSGSFTWKNSGHEFRYENPGPSGTRIMVSGHGTPGLLDGGRLQKFSRQAAVSNLPPHLMALFLLRAVANPSVGAQVLGTAVVSGRQAILMQIAVGTWSPNSGPIGQRWYFDAATGLPLRVEYRIFADRDPRSSVQVAQEFADYRSISGVMVPFQITTYHDGHQDSITTLTSVAFNTAISPTDFDLPAGGAQ